MGGVLRSALILLALSAACQPLPTRIALDLECSPSAAFNPLTVRIRSSGLGLDATRSFAGDGGTGVVLPDRLMVPIADRAAELQIEVEGRDSAGRLRKGSGTVTSVVNQTVGLTVSLSVFAECLNGKQDGDESDLDCGGTRCPACPLGARCLADRDCQTTACAQQSICSFASGPPFWRSGAAFKPNRGLFGSAVVPDAGIYAVGGTSDLNTELTRVDIYDSQLEAWKTGPALPAGRFAHGVGFFAGRLWAIAGKPNPTRVDLLVPGEATWSQGPALSVGRSEFGLAVGNGRLYLAGGSLGGILTDQVDILDADGGWRTGSPLAVARTYPALVAMSDGSLFAVGGSNGAALTIIERYLPEQNVWTKTPAMPTARFAAAAIEAPDGRLWVVGGDRNGSLRTVEAYFPPPIGKWVGLPPLLEDRAYCAVQKIPDGRLLVFGGFASGIQPLNGELYGPAVTVSPTLFRPGTMGVINGDNFAADAGVTVTLSPDNWVLGTGSTDARGALVSPISFSMPSVQPSEYRLTVIDSRSRYPIVLKVVVAP